MRVGYICMYAKAIVIVAFFKISPIHNKRLAPELNNIL